jgi:hypothetical protein
MLVRLRDFKRGGQPITAVYLTVIPKASKSTEIFGQMALFA